MSYVSGLFQNGDIANQLFQLVNIIEYANKNKLKIGFKKDTNLIFKKYFDVIHEDDKAYIIHDFNMKNYDFTYKTKKKLIDIIYSDENKMDYVYKLFNKIKTDYCFDDNDNNYHFNCDSDNKIIIKTDNHAYIINNEEDDYTKLLLMTSFMENGKINSYLSLWSNLLGSNKKNIINEMI